MKKALIVLLVFFALAAFTFAGGAREINEPISTDPEAVEDFTERGLVDPAIPDSWYISPMTASEWGISTFNESPLLKSRVASRELPPVEERLPDDPPVIEPYERVGKYGGTATVWATQLNSTGWASEALIFIRGANYLRSDPTASKMLPYILKDWKFSDDYMTFTVYLWEGLKFSNGDPLTADDYMYWWNHVANNKDLSPVPPQDSVPTGIENVIKIDDYTVRFILTQPDVWFHVRLGDRGISDPHKYLSQFHPDFVDKAELEAKAKEKGFDHWYQYYSYMHTGQHGIVFPDRVRPNVKPFIPVERSESHVLFERNPFFAFVDTEGNQLPYIDHIRTNLASSNELMTAKAVTGEATMAGQGLDFVDLPLIKQNEQKGDYKTYIFTHTGGTAVSLYPNFTHSDLKLREIFNDVRFRKAMSHALDRDAINEKVFFGMATPSQSTVTVTSQFWEESFAQSFAKYDPDEARRLLADMGMEDVNGDGFVEQPDGSKFNPMLTTAEYLTPKVDVLEMAVEFWKDVGLNIDFEIISISLKISRWHANEFDMGEWVVERTTDPIITLTPIFTLAPAWPVGQTPWCPMPLWLKWNGTKGKEGEEPPEHIKQIIRYLETFTRSSDPEVRFEAGKNLVRAQAENLWTIGTVAQMPFPVVVSNKLHNVPKFGLKGSDTHNWSSFYPVQFYLD